jgi:hypothetical protein
MSKCLLGLEFAEYLGIAKNAIREGAEIDGKPVQNPGAYLNSLLVKAITEFNVPTTKTIR